MKLKKLSHKHRKQEDFNDTTLLSFSHRNWKAKLDEKFGKFIEVIQKLYINIPLLDAIQDQLSYNKKIEPQLAQLAGALPFATNLEKVNAITTRGGKSTHDPLYPTRIGKAPVEVQEEEKENDIENGP